MTCTDPKCQVVLSSEEFCYVSPCTYNGSSYPKTMASNKLLGCEDGSTTTCHQPKVGCCY